MGSESRSASQDERDSDDDEDYEEAGGGNRLLGFMFGNVDNSGELEVDYLDEDAKEHLDALADKLGQSLTDIDLSGKSPQLAVAAAEEDYDEKAEDAVDYEDIDEQYEGPETEIATEEDHLLPKREYFLTAAITEPKSSVFDDENYDEDEDEDMEKEPEPVVHKSEVESFAVPGSVLNQQDNGKIDLVDDSEIHAAVQPENEEVLDEESYPVLIEISAGFTDFHEEGPAASYGSEEPRHLTPFPILFVEDGMAILRFSELFGDNEPPKRAVKREHKYSVPKDRYISLEPSHMVEDDEQAFLKGPLRGFSHRKLSQATQDEYESSIEENAEFGQFDPAQATCADARKDPCLSGEPMRKDCDLGRCVERNTWTSMESYTLDQQEWEDRIVWGNSPVASDNSLESCELSEPDSESLVHEERESILRPDSRISINRMPKDDKENECHISLSFISVKPFGSRDPGTSDTISCTESLYHPQLLRLETRLDMDTLHLSGKKKEVTSKEDQQVDFMKRFKQLTLQNKDLVEGSWVENILWESEKPIAKPKLILDLQDEQMVFEILDNKEYENLQLHAGAMITTRNQKAGADSFELPGHAALSVARFNIGNDKFYSNRKTSLQLKSLSKKRAAHSVKILHSIPALKLQTIKAKLSNKDVANFHRPKAAWYPHDNEVAVKEQEKLPTEGPMKVILKSLGGKGSKFHVSAEETISSFKAKASKKLDFRPTETVRIFYFGKELEDQKTLAEQNVRPNSLLHLVRTKIHLWPMAQKLPNENKSLHPPGAFKKKSDLSVKDGHVFLMEYCEERPLLLGNIGMGARLCTYYQKSSSDDQTGDMLRSSASGLGTVLTLNPADKSPFLGDIKPGCSQSCLETNMYRAPVFPHKVASTDYLLVRSAKGKLSIRRIDKIHVVGQQEPHMEVMSPVAKGLQMYLMNRLLVYMYREFRDAEKRGMLPWIRADELSAQFPIIYEPFLRKRLKPCADLQKGPNGHLHWVMRRNFHSPPEEELRRMVTPETICAYESMLAGLYHLQRLGITRLAHLTGPTQLTALASAMNQLPDEAIALAAASHIERELLITPWNLSANFVACTSQDRGNIERLEISGVGDPSGRGLGFSFVRIAAKPPMSNTLIKKKPVVAKGTTVTGTDADLRRLSMEAAREVLLKFNISDEQIEKLSRWHRIALIRKLSSEKATSGVQVDSATISKFARGQRMSFLQLQQQTREKCQEVWDRQIQSLSAVEGDDESDSEANSDLDSFAGDLENLLDAEGEEGQEGNKEMKNHKSDGVKGLKMRRHSSQARVEEEVEDETAEAAELCRMLIDDDDAQWKKKKKSKPSVEAFGQVRTPQPNFGLDNAERVKTPTVMVKHTDGPTISDSPMTGKQNADLEVEKLLSKSVPLMKPKATKKIELPVSLLNKKVKIMTEGIKGFKEKKSARESFVCGACGQLGHMRTNKNCPKYGEDPETPTVVDPEKESNKPSPQDASQSQQKIPPKKLITKIATKAPEAEVPEEEISSSKAKFLKVRYTNSDMIPDKVTPVPALSSEQPSTSDPEAGNKSAPKAIKIVSNKSRPDDVPVESHKLNVVIRPPTETGKEHSHKKITIKQPKEIIDLDQVSPEGVDVEYRKTKKMVELTGYGANGQQDNRFLAEDAMRRKKREARRMWEEEEKRRIAEQMREDERVRWLYEEEMRRVEEQDRLAELRRYEEDLRREREEEERRKAKKRKKKTKSIELHDGYLDDFRSKRTNKSLPDRERTAKRKPVVELGRYGAEYIPPTKRRRGGEVGLANILESIVEALKNNKNISFLFLKPVSKKDAPDYLDIVKQPMDLSTIRDKVRRLEYKDRDEFRDDVWQIAENAHIYNDGRNPGIPPLADQLLEMCDYLLNDFANSLDEAEASIDRE